MERADTIEFIPPLEGTPAFEALEANAAIELSRAGKFIKKKVKRPKLKNITRNRKTRKSRQNSFSQRFKGKLIDGLHELYTLTIGMSFGIRVAIGRQDVFENEALNLEHFMHVDKYVFPPGGNSKSPHRTPPHPLKHTFKFKNYAPKVFRRIRNVFGIDSASYMMSVCGNNNYLEFISNSKSGQFFFYSHDGRYMIKTQTREENKFLRRILPQYYKYVVQHTNTHLVRFYGMHRVKMYHLRRKVHFVIMGSVFNTTEMIHTIYDLKGSKIGRSITPEQREKGGVRKDMDLLRDGVKMHLGDKKARFMQQVAEDAAFLSKLNIMDYSLLVGIHDTRIIADEPEMPNALPTPSALRSNTPFRRHLSSSLSFDPEHGLQTPSALGRSRAGSSDVPVHDVSSSGSHSDAVTEFAVERPQHLHVHLQELPEEDKSDEHGQEGEDDEDEDDASSSHSSHDDDHPHSGGEFEDPYGNEPSMFSEGGAEFVVGLNGEGEATQPRSHARSPSAQSPRHRSAWSNRSDGGILGVNVDGTRTGEIYYTGIIDILQQYNTIKFAEHFFKSFTQNRREISSVPANFYASRFIQFLDENTD